MTDTQPHMIISMKYYDLLYLPGDTVSIIGNLFPTIGTLICLNRTIIGLKERKEIQK
jgi:hypothetical protein